MGKMDEEQAKLNKEKKREAKEAAMKKRKQWKVTGFTGTHDNTFNSSGRRQEAVLKIWTDDEYQEKVRQDEIAKVKQAEHAEMTQLAIEAEKLAPGLSKSKYYLNLAKEWSNVRKCAVVSAVNQDDEKSKE